ncbi:MAG: elongation factor P maturation arginine rhamnosyltransferase EarP [Burkholderiaceae bacterium]
MKLSLLCPVVDNYGDAGIGWRLARQIQARWGWQVDIWTNDAATFRRLLSAPQAAAVAWSEKRGTRQTRDIRILQAMPSGVEDLGEAVVEVFSAEPPTNLTTALVTATTQKPWIIFEYLSAESWVGRFHLQTSIDPRNGFKKIYFYPGFDERSGGLLQTDDAGRKVCSIRNASPAGRRIFVFAYPHAPLNEWPDALTSNDWLWLAAPALPEACTDAANIVAFDWLPQTEFDEFLTECDWLFVRGEDSFVAAQRAAKPLVWQIYPTTDSQHWVKLEAFFERYAQGLSENAKYALWRLWCVWNGGRDDPKACSLAHAWDRALQHEDEIAANALRWYKHLQDQPDLLVRLKNCLIQEGIAAAAFA